MADNEIVNSRDDIGKWVGRVSRRRFQLSECLLERMGIGPGQVPILSELKFHGEMTQRQLAEHTHVTAATVSGTLKRMERARLIYRSDDINDARVSIVRLTEEGERIVKEAWQLFGRADHDMLNGFTDEECDKLLDYLERMRNNIDISYKALER